MKYDRKWLFALYLCLVVYGGAYCAENKDKESKQTQTPPEEKLIDQPELTRKNSIKNLSMLIVTMSTSDMVNFFPGNSSYSLGEKSSSLSLPQSPALSNFFPSQQGSLFY
jgi:hypothetical protein